jgi:hypothetical protein
MKKLMVIGAALIAALTSYGQGTVNFANTANASYYLTTNKNFTAPFASGVLNGSGKYIVGIFVGGGSDPLTFTVGGYGTNSVLTGRFANTPLHLAGYNANDTVTFQVRAWSSALGYDWATISGKIASDWWSKGYATESSPGVAAGYYFGASTIGSTTAGGGTTQPGDIFGGSPLIGTFALNEIHPVPEPSTIALGALGLLGVLFIRRRK